jgi:hypothetical protein
MAWTDKLAEFLRLNDGEQAYTGYPQMQVGLNKPRKAGYATGFLEGATGADSMQPKNPITDPNYDQYAQGKNIGEAVGIGAMAIPGYAMALKAGAPKAYNALENYMVKSGGMIPLEAYHGTPHTIKGQFDINKVGTGEGNQSYGHGMYFGQAKETGETYRKALSGRTELGEMPSDPAFIHAVESFREVGTPLNAIPAEMKKAYKSATDKDINLAIQATEKGNLYKVDIPDKDIPNMLNWDERVPEDLRKRISAATLEQFGNGATGTSGEHLYKEIVFEMRRNGSKTPEADASKWLLNQGIPGIKYLDEGSRNWRMLTPEESTSGKYVVGKWPGGGKESKQFDNLEDAQKYFDKNQTKNFVVFEPSTVKILEENSKPISRKALIEKQVKDLKD